MRIVLVVASVLALAACGGGEEEGAAPRQAAPPIAGTTLDGEELTLEEFRGKPVMVNAWASW